MTPETREKRFDLHEESADELHRLRGRHGDLWLRSEAKEAGLGLLLCVTGALLVWQLGGEIDRDAAEVAKLAEPSRAVGRTIQAPKSFLYTAGFLFGFLAIPAGSVVVLASIGSAVRGVPAAPKTPQASSKRFAKSMLRTTQRKPFRLEAFVCLLRHARGAIGDDYQEFEQYCDGLSRAIRRATQDAARETDLTLTDAEVTEVRAEIDGDHASARVTTNLSAAAQKELNGVEGKYELPSTYNASFNLQLARVAGRWYVANLDVEGCVLPPDSEGRRAEFAYGPSSN